MIRSLPILAQSAATASSKLVDCKGCTECCERGGPVYVQDDELSRLAELGVPLISIDGVSFIKRLQDGSCPMLDKIGRKCSIYENRPLCCRLFPLDVLSISGRMHWAVSTQCPEDRKLFSELQGRHTSLGFGSVGLIASVLDDNLTNDDVAYFAQKEFVSARLELLDAGDDRWVSLVDCAKGDHTHEMRMARKNETPKEKLKRMLKERARRKKAEEKKRKAKETTKKSRKK